MMTEKERRQIYDFLMTIRILAYNEYKKFPSKFSERIFLAARELIDELFKDKKTPRNGHQGESENKKPVGV